MSRAVAIQPDVIVGEVNHGREYGSVILNDWNRDRQAKQQKQVVRRSFEAAKVNRLTSSFLATSASIDRELRGQLNMLRGRSRSLFRNNEYAKKFGRMVRSNLVGPNGFLLQAQSLDAPDKPDRLANKSIEAAHKRWCRKGVCEVSGRYSKNDADRALATAVARDGEVLIRLVRGAASQNEFNFAFQVLDIDRLDTMMNLDPIAGRNAVVMGVEMDAYRRPVAYWIFKSHPNGGLGGNRERERVPAADIIHAFVPDDELEQARGLPWMHAAMLRLNDLGAYREAAIIASRIGAQQMGFFSGGDGGLDGMSDNGEASHDVDGLEMEAEAGVFRGLPEGTTFTAFNPDYPHQQFDMFFKSCLRGIASGIGVAYHGFANDLEGVNFSSIRAGVMEERDEWMVLQNWFIEAILIPLYEAWLEMALLSGAITMPNGSALPTAKMSKFMAHSWQGRRWAWVDPLKDLKAAKMAMDENLTSPQRIAASQGVDIEDVLDEIKRFKEMLKEKGLDEGDLIPNQGKPDE